MQKTQRKLPLTAAGAALSLTLLLALSGCGPRGSGADKAGADKGGKGGGPAAAQNAANAPTPVTVAPATEQEVARTVPVNGSIAALQSVSLSPKVSARVLSVVGREGDTVRAGQVLVQQDTSDLQQSLEQALANLQAAQARVTQARTNYNIQQTTSATGVQNAQAALRSAQAALRAAQANLALAKQPQRTEQVSQAEIAVQQAQANYDRAVADRKRYEYLVKEGASAQATLDQYVTTEAVQRANLESARQGLRISQTGGRQESVRASQEQARQAESQVRQAEIALRQARANVAQNQAKLDDIRAAEATVAQNQAAVNLARRQIADASVRSPIDGVIATRATEPGQQAAPGASLMTVVALGTVYFQAQVPETNISDVQRGRGVVVRVDAVPGKTFTGRVSDVFPTASTSSRAFSVRVNVPNSGRTLRPGMYARGQVVAERRRGVVVPKDALIADGEQFAVFVAENGKAVRHPVKLGIQTSETAEVLSGVKTGDQIIVQGQTLVKDGGPITVEGRGEGVSAARMLQQARL
jgi:RND family efflux transporter MFP subunit